jgi:hypothetical protein
MPFSIFNPFATKPVDAASIGSGAVTNAKLANMATGTVKAKITSGTGAPSDVTLADLTTAMAGTTEGKFFVLGPGNKVPSNLLPATKTSANLPYYGNEGDVFSAFESLISTSGVLLYGQNNVADEYVQVSLLKIAGSIAEGVYSSDFALADATDATYRRFHVYWSTDFNCWVIDGGTTYGVCQSLGSLADGPLEASYQVGSGLDWQTITMDYVNGPRFLGYEVPPRNNTLPGFVSAQLATSQTAVMQASLSKSVPNDADTLVYSDSELDPGSYSFGPEGRSKYLSFANLWSWVLSKLGVSLTIGGAKTWTGVQRATGQNATPATPEELLTRDSSDVWNTINGVRSWPTQNSLLRQQVSGAAVSAASSAGVALVESSTTAGSVHGVSWGSAGFNGQFLCYPGDAILYVNFSRRHILSFDVYTNIVPTGTALVWFGIGSDPNSSFGNGGALSSSQPAAKGFGIKFDSSGFRTWVHNGTTYSESAAIAYTNGTYATIILDANNGTLNGSINGAAFGVLSSGPTGLSTGDYHYPALIAKAGGTSERARLYIANPKSLTRA